MATQFTTDYKSGPLAALEQQGYSTSSFTYPIDLTTDPGEQHFIIFYINQADNTQFATKAKGGELVDGAKSASPTGPNSIPQIKSSSNLTTWNKRPISRVSTAITLYMPPGITSNYNPVWDQVEGNATFGALKAASDGEIGRIFKEMGAGLVSQTLDAATDALKTATGATTNIKDAASIATNIARNPHKEALFRTIGFREFAFDFKFTPRSEQEAQNVANIIQAFSFYAAPEIKQGDAARYMIYPSEFDIEFWSNGKPNEFIKKISTCACTGVSVNYTSSGGWSAFRAGSINGVSVETTLSLSFMELELITKNRILQGY